MNLSDLYSKIRGPERAEIAERAGTSPQTLQVWARHWVNPRTGKTRKPSIEQIRSLAKADKRLKVKDMMEEFYPADKGE